MLKTSKKPIADPGRDFIVLDSGRKFRAQLGGTRSFRLCTASSDESA